MRRKVSPTLILVTPGGGVAPGIPVCPRRRALPAEWIPDGSPAIPVIGGQDPFPFARKLPA